MIFISSTVPIDQIPNTCEEIDKTGQFYSQYGLTTRIMKKTMNCTKCTTDYVGIPFSIKRNYITISRRITITLKAGYIKKS